MVSDGSREVRPAILNHLDDDLASCTPRFEVRPSLFGGCEREDPIHDRPDDARFNERCDLAQLLAVRSHENKRVANAVVLGLLPDTGAQQAHALLQEPVRPVLLGERYIRRTGDGNELSTGLQHLEGLFERVLAQTVQDDVVAAQDLLEILLLVVDDDIRAETFDQIDIRCARRSRHRCADVLCQLNGECAYSTGTRMDQDFWPFFRWARSISTCQAVRPTRGMDAASSMVRFLGFNATSASFMAMNSANVPIRS